MCHCRSLRKGYPEPLQVLYDLFQKARKDGLIGLEAHIEGLEKSGIFRKYALFAGRERDLPPRCSERPAHRPPPITVSPRSPAV
jgi:hypothetical protein